MKKSGNFILIKSWTMTNWLKWEDIIMLPDVNVLTHQILWIGKKGYEEMNMMYKKKTKKNKNKTRQKTKTKTKIKQNKAKQRKT